MGAPRGLQQFKTDLVGVAVSLYLAWIATLQRCKLRLKLLRFAVAYRASTADLPCFALAI